MPTVQELNVLHRRYAELSHRFRAAWTFHQFLQSLFKTVLERPAIDLSDAFQDLYVELKELSQNLNTTESERTRARLDVVDRRLGELISALQAEDSRVGADVLRQFFRRVKNYDEKILTQLVRFHIYSRPRSGWDASELDKLDFLLARLCEEDETGQVGSGLILRDSKRLTEIFEGLWFLLGAPPLDAQIIAARRREVEALKMEISDVDSLDRLNERELIGRFRELKHGLGDLFFEPSLLLAVQSTNLALRGRIGELYRQEEQRFVAEYQRVFELEREVPGDADLDAELSEFREQIERFELRLGNGDFKLEDVAQIRESVRILLPRLIHAGGGGGSVRIFEDTGEIRRAAAPIDPAFGDAVFGEHYRRIVAAVQDLPPSTGAREATFTAEMYPLRLEPREITACRLLCADEAADRELEQFILEAAALRLRAMEEAQGIASLLDETTHTGEAPIYDLARRTADIGDGFLARFGHQIHRALLAGDVDRARELELLRMRLMREISGLWLLAYKPFYHGKATWPRG